MLIRIQKEINAAMLPLAANRNLRAKTRPAQANKPQFTYHFVNPKVKPTLVPFTQDGDNIEENGVAATKNVSWRCDGKKVWQNQHQLAPSRRIKGGTTPIHG